MELVLVRNERTATSTIGDLFVDDEFCCFVLEDVVRTGPKVYGKTAIPAGKYEVAITFSNRFQKYLPLLLKVPDFEGIRIHSGNISSQTEGCLLPGMTKSKDFVGDSRKAFNKLFAKMKAVEKKEKIWITIV